MFKFLKNLFDKTINGRDQEYWNSNDYKQKLDQEQELSKTHDSIAPVIKQNLISDLYKAIESGSESKIVSWISRADSVIDKYGFFNINDKEKISDLLLKAGYTKNNDNLSETLTKPNQYAQLLTGIFLQVLNDEYKSGALDKQTVIKYHKLARESKELESIASQNVNERTK